MSPETQQPEEQLKSMHLSQDDPNYDEYSEKNLDKVVKGGLTELFKAAEIQANATEEEIAEMQKEVEDAMLDDPYRAWVLRKYKNMGPVKIDLLKSVAAKKPLNGIQILAFTGMVTKLDFAHPSEDSLFNLSYLKLLASSMTSDQRVYLMLKLPGAIQAAVVATMQKTGMVTPEEVDSYITKKAEGTSDPVGYAERYKEKVVSSVAEIDRELGQLKEGRVTYSFTRHEKPKNEIEREYTIQNAALGGGLFVGIMTLVINTGGAFRKLIIERDPAGAWDHIMNHPYAGASALSILGFRRALKSADRPKMEIVAPKKRSRLTTLINEGVSKLAISHLKNQKFFYALQSDFESRTDTENMSTLPLKQAFPKVYANLSSRGLLPQPHEEADMVKDLVNLYTSLRSWNYWSYGACFSFADYCEKNYSKVTRAEAMRKADEQEDKAKK